MYFGEIYLFIYGFIWKSYITDSEGKALISLKVGLSPSKKFYLFTSMKAF